MYRNSNASVRHPAPNGWRHFVNRAIAQGRDRVYRRYPDPRHLPLRDAVSRLREHLRALSGMVKHRTTVDLRLWELPLALGLGAVYHLLQFSGEVGTRMNPAWMRQRFQI